MIKKLWILGEKSEIYQILIDQWLDIVNEDFNYITSWAITVLPIIDKKSVPLEYNEELEQFLLDIIKKDTYKIYKFWKIKKSFHAALILSYYFNLLEPREIAEHIYRFFRANVNSYIITY